MVEGVVGPAAFLGNLDKAFLSGVTSSSVVGTIPENLWMMFQVSQAAWVTLLPVQSDQQSDQVLPHLLA